MSKILFFILMLQPVLSRAEIVKKVVINYPSGDFRLDSEAIAKLNDVRSTFFGRRGLVLEVRGHTDDVGTAAYNLNLSKDRAMRVRNWLHEYGVEARRIVVRWFGEGDLLDSLTTAPARARNRRVELVVATSDDPLVAKLPDEAFSLEDMRSIEDASQGCRVHFSGLLISGSFLDNWFSSAFVEDRFSEVIGCGDFPRCTDAFPKAAGSTFDGIAVASGTRLIIFENTYFRGDTLLDVTGPAVVNNGMYRSQWRDTVNKQLRNLSLPDFPRRPKRWSKTNMHKWSYGSVRIICNRNVEE